MHAGRSAEAGVRMRNWRRAAHRPARRHRGASAFRRHSREIGEAELSPSSRARGRSHSTSTLPCCPVQAAARARGARDRAARGRESGRPGRCVGVRAAQTAIPCRSRWAPIQHPYCARWADWRPRSAAYSDSRPADEAGVEPRKGGNLVDRRWRPPTAALRGARDSTRNASEDRARLDPHVSRRTPAAVGARAEVPALAGRVKSTARLRGTAGRRQLHLARAFAPTDYSERRVTKP